MGIEPKLKCLDCIQQRPMCANGCDSAGYVKKGGLEPSCLILGTLL
nr:MAG TPA: hypothetical protein [Caudoviricetes sp.]